jgi:hypothetical protein
VSINDLADVLPRPIGPKAKFETGISSAHYPTTEERPPELRTELFCSAVRNVSPARLLDKRSANDSNPDGKETS